MGTPDPSDGKDVAVTKKKKKGLLQKVRAANLFPEYVEHGQPSIVLRGMVKTLLFLVLLLGIGLSILLQKLGEDLPSLRINKDTDARLGKPSFNDYLTINDMVVTKGWAPLICPCGITQVKTLKMFADGMTKNNGKAAKLQRRLREDSVEGVSVGGGEEGGFEFPAPGETDTTPDDSLSPERKLAIVQDGRALENVTFYEMIDECLDGKQQLSFAMLKKFPVAYRSGTGSLRDHTLLNPTMGRDYGTVAGSKFLEHFKARSSDADAWSAADFISEADFKAEMINNWPEYFEIRNISIRGLCSAADNLIQKNKNAYLARFLSSPTLMEKRTIRSVLNSRFVHMKDLSLSTFNIAFEQDTFRMDFEGLVSTWGKQVNSYIDSLHATNTGAMLDAYESMFNFAVGATFRNLLNTGIPNELWDVEYCVNLVTGVQMTDAARETHIQQCQNNLLPQYGFWMPTEVPVDTKISVASPNPEDWTSAQKNLQAADANVYKSPFPIVRINRPYGDEEIGGKQVYGQCWRPAPKTAEYMCSGPGGLTHKCLNMDRATCMTNSECKWQPRPHMRPTALGFNVWEAPNLGADFKGFSGFVDVPSTVTPYTAVDCCSSLGAWVDNQCSQRCWGTNSGCKAAGRDRTLCLAVKNPDGSNACEYNGVGQMWEAVKTDGMAKSTYGECTTCNKVTGSGTVCYSAPLVKTFAHAELAAPYNQAGTSLATNTLTVATDMTGYSDIKVESYIQITPTVGTVCYATVAAIATNMITLDAGHGCTDFASTVASIKVVAIEAQSCTALQKEYLEEKYGYHLCCPHHPDHNPTSTDTNAADHGKNSDLPASWWEGKDTTLSKVCKATDQGGCVNRVRNALEYDNFVSLGGTVEGTRGWKDLGSAWWSGALPKKNVVSNPTGAQLSAFSSSVMKYQAYCARHNLPSMLLYDADKPRTPSELPAPRVSHASRR